MARAASQLNWSLVLLTVWYAGIAFIVLRQIVARIQLSRLSRRAQPIEMAALQSSIGNRQSTIPFSVLVSDHVDVPLTWGMFHARILLPSSYTEWDGRRLENVLRHELAHISRRDVFTALLADIACALFWYNPLVWHAATRMRIEREIACDEAVLAAGARPSDYASDLLDLAVNVRFGALHRAGLAIAGCPRFEQRLRAILDTAPRGGLTRVASTAVFAAALCVLPLAAFQVATQPQEKIYPIPDARTQAFQLAVTAGQFDKMVAMATADPALINARAREGQEALYLALTSASKFGSTEAQWLLAHGADVNAQVTGLMGDTPLMVAVERKPEMVDFLLSHGADPEITDNIGRTALDNGLQLQSLGLFRRSEKRQQEVHEALQHLIEHGAHVSFVSAIRLPDVDLVRKYLADDPSLIHQQFPNGYGKQTPLEIALLARREDRDTYEPVVAAINSYVNDPTPCEAAMLGRTDLLASLAPQKSEKVNDPYNIPRELVPLNCAVMAGERGTVQFLLDHGAKPNIADLRWSLRTDAATVALLLNAGAGKGQTKDVFESFAKIADRSGNKDIADLLRARAR